MRKASLIIIIITVLIIGLLLIQLPGAGPDWGYWILESEIMNVALLGGVLSLSLFVASKYQAKKVDLATQPSTPTPNPKNFVSTTNYIFLALMFLLFIPIAIRVSPEILVCVKTSLVKTADFNYCPISEWLILIVIDLIFAAYLFILSLLIVKDSFKPIKFGYWFTVVIVPALGAMLYLLSMFITYFIQILGVIPLFFSGYISFYSLGDYIFLGHGEPFWGVNFPVSYLWSAVIVFIFITQLVIRRGFKTDNVQAIPTQATDQNNIIVESQPANIPKKPLSILLIIFSLIIIAILALPLLFRRNYVSEETTNLPEQGVDFKSYTFPNTNIKFSYPPTWTYQVVSDQEVKLTPPAPASDKVWATVKLEDVNGKKFSQYLQDFQNSTSALPQEDSSVSEVERNGYKYAHLVSDENDTTDYWLFIKGEKVVILTFPGIYSAGNEDSQQLIDLDNVAVNSLISP